MHSYRTVRADARRPQVARQAGTSARSATDAAQFMPFAALTGFEEMARDQERPSREPRRVPTEERAEQVSRMLVRLQRGDEVEVEHYDRRAYATTVGTVREVNAVLRVLELEGGRRILFEDIWDLQWA